MIGKEFLDVAINPPFSLSVGQESVVTFTPTDAAGAVAGSATFILTASDPTVAAIVSKTAGSVLQGLSAGSVDVIATVTNPDGSTLKVTAAVSVVAATPAPSTTGNATGGTFKFSTPVAVGTTV